MIYNAIGSVSAWPFGRVLLIALQRGLAKSRNDQNVRYIYVMNALFNQQSPAHARHQPVKNSYRSVRNDPKHN